jgi:hypothetical protein
VGRGFLDSREDTLMGGVSGYISCIESDHVRTVDSTT